MLSINDGVFFFIKSHHFSAITYVVVGISTYWRVLQNKQNDPFSNTFANYGLAEG
jgi:uncharacterized membrane protein YuzA (DUF378 family)